MSDDVFTEADLDLAFTILSELDPAIAVTDEAKALIYKAKALMKRARSTEGGVQIKVLGGRP